MKSFVDFSENLEDKKIHKLNLVGFSARVFLHEYDHMEGIVFTQRNLNN